MIIYTLECNYLQCLVTIGLIHTSEDFVRVHVKDVFFILFR